MELRDLPSVDELARGVDDPLAVDAARAVIDRAREEIRAGAEPGDLTARLHGELRALRTPSLRRVNALPVYVSAARMRPLGRRSSSPLTSVRLTRDVSKKSTSLPSVVPNDAAHVRYCGVAMLKPFTTVSMRSDGANGVGAPPDVVAGTYKPAYRVGSKA